MPLQSERRDRIGDGIDQKLPPGQRRKFTAQENTQRRALEQLREGAAVRVIRRYERVLGNMAQADAIGAQPLAIIVHECRDNDRASG